MKRLFQTMLLPAMILCCSATSATTEVYLPEGQNIHTLDIHADDDVIVYLSDHAVLDGSIKTDGDITITAHEDVDKTLSLTLNSTLMLAGVTEDTPYTLNMSHLGNITLNNAIALRGGLLLSNLQDARVEINKNLDVSRLGIEVMNSETDVLQHRNSGVYIKGGVIINAWNVDIDAGQGSFYSDGGVVITAPVFLLEAAHQVTSYGEINGGYVSLQGKQSADMHIHSIMIDRNLGGFITSGLSIFGANTINLYKDLVYRTYCSLGAKEINLYGVNITTPTDWSGGSVTIGPAYPNKVSRLNAYGAHVESGVIYLYSDINDYGLSLDADFIEYLTPDW